jgi:hypothetical protein
MMNLTWSDNRAPANLRDASPFVASPAIRSRAAAGKPSNTPTPAPKPGRSPKLQFLAIIALLSLLLTGCVTFPEKLAGRFDAPNGDFIIIKPDGSLHWSPPSNTTDDLTYVGMVVPQQGNPLLAMVSVPATSPYPNARVAFSPKHNQVSIDWGTPKPGTTQYHAPEYFRHRVEPADSH